MHHVVAVALFVLTLWVHALERGWPEAIAVHALICVVIAVILHRLRYRSTFIYADATDLFTGDPWAFVDHPSRGRCLADQDI